MLNEQVGLHWNVRHRTDLKPTEMGANKGTENREKTP